MRLIEQGWLGLAGCSLVAAHWQATCYQLYCPGVAVGSLHSGAGQDLHTIVKPAAISLAVIKYSRLCCSGMAFEVGIAGLARKCSPQPLLQLTGSPYSSVFAVQVWRCEVDIPGLARTCSDGPLLLGFLQRRQQVLHPQCDIKALLLSTIKVSRLSSCEMLATRVSPLLAKDCHGAASAVHSARHQGSAGVHQQRQVSGAVSHPSHAQLKI